MSAETASEFFDSHVFKSIAISTETPRIPKVVNGYKANLDYGASFNSSVETPEAIALLESLQSARTALELKLPTSDLDGIISCIDDYLPHLFRLIWSLKSNPAVPIAKLTVFEWVGSFQLAPTTRKFQVFSFELVMCLHTLAIAHSTKARNMLFNGSDDYSAAAKCYLTASSIMDYVATSLLPRWSNSGPRPPEAEEEVCMAFSFYYQALAQKCAVLKAITKSGDVTPAGTIARLSIAVTNLCNSAFQSLDCMELEKRALLNPVLAADICYTRDLLMGVACYQHSVSLSSKGECGAAIAFLRKAKIHLTQRALPAGQSYGHPPGIPPLKGPFATGAAGVEKLLNIISRAEDILDHENRSIYFQPVPQADAMPELPRPALIMNKPVFEEPRQGELVHFVKDHAFETMQQPGNMGTIATPATADAATAAPSAPIAGAIVGTGDTTRTRSDSDLARELQAQFDAEGRR